MPFTLEKPYRTRDGRRAWVVRSPELLGTANKDTLVGWVDIEGYRLPNTWREDGSYGGTTCGLDLVNVPEHHIGWAAVYASVNFERDPNRSAFAVGAMFTSKEAAVQHTQGQLTRPFAVVKLEFEDERQAGVGGGT